MGYPVRLSVDARREYEDAIGWYAGRSVDAALRFERRVTEAIEQIANNPTLWPKVAPRLHRCPLPRYPFYLIYAVREEAIEVLAVAHTSRRPGYWKDRLSSG